MAAKYTMPSVRSFRTSLAGLVANGLVQATLVALTILLLKHAVDELISFDESRGYGTLVASISGLFIAWALIAMLKVIERTQAEVLGQKYIGELRLRLFDRLAITPSRALNRRSRGSFMLKFVTDLSAIRLWVGRGISAIIVSSIASITAISVLLVISWPLGTVSALSFILAIFLTIRLGGPLQERTREQRRRRSFIASNLGQLVATMGTVQAFDQVRRERRHIRKQTRRSMRAASDAIVYVGIVRNLPSLIFGGAVALVILLGAVEVRADRTTVGSIVATIGIMSYLASMVNEMALAAVYRSRFTVARHVILRFMENEPELEQSSEVLKARRISGKLEFKGIKVDGIFKRLDGIAEAGSKIVITGHSGAGKSTLLSLAAHLLEPDAGKVLLDGHDLRRYRKRTVRAGIGIVSPDVPLIRGSIRRNITYRDPGIGEHEYKALLEKCGITECMKRFNLSDTTKLYENGANLPQELRTRIQIARAIVGSPEILLLDEPADHLDPAGRTMLFDLLNDWKGTCLIATNDPEFVRWADEAWHLDSGTIATIRPGAGPANEDFEGEPIPAGR